MAIQITIDVPTHPSLHVDFDERLSSAAGGARGALLGCVDPDQLLAVARALPRRGPALDWVLWDVDAIPLSERRIGAWVATLGNVVRADVLLLMRRRPNSRLRRIEGHVVRARGLRR